MTRPELMIIGDSLAQGCRSLSVKKDYCEQSYGVRIARSQRWEFDTPQHPRPILFDLEREIRNLVPSVLDSLITWKIFPGLINRIKTNIRDWIADLTSGNPITDIDCFSNIGVAGFVVSDLYKTAGEFKKEALEYISKEKLFDLDDVDFVKKIEPLHEMINAAYTLNPSGTAENDKSAIDWVKIKKPRRLIVQILHNNPAKDGVSLFETGFAGEFTTFSYDDFAEDLDKLAQDLATLPPEIEEIYYFLLPKVGAVANLRPSSRPKNGYSRSYRPVLYPTPNRLSGEELSEADNSIEQTNLELKTRFRSIFEAVSKGNSKRLHFIDAYELFDEFDYKNTRDEDREIPIGKKRINNMPLDGEPRTIGPASKRKIIGYGLVEGGFQSVDGMHPSALGYGVMATKVMDTMQLEYDKTQILNEAYHDDKLLTNFSRNVESIYHLIQLVQGFMSEPEPNALADVQASMAEDPMQLGARGKSEKSLAAAGLMTLAVHSIVRKSGN